MDGNWLMIYSGLAAVVAELIVGAGTGFDLLLIGLALITGGAVGNFTGDWETGILTATLLMVAYLVFGRNLIKKRLNFASQPSNMDRLLGKTGTVIKTGQAKVESEIWRIQSESRLGVGDKVKVVAIEGTALKVVKSA